jgi:ubiquinone/menaquinone biosynthesis C-methylase UbiE
MKKIINLAEVVAKALDEKNGKSFLDIGCGFGSLAKAVKRLRPDLKVVAIDIAKPYIDYAKKDPQGVEFKIGDIRKLRFKKDEFDLVFTLGVFIHVPKKDIRRAIREALRVGRTGIHIESSKSVLRQSHVRKYRPKVYWTKRAFKQAPSRSDLGTKYYFAHDYAKLFNERKVQVRAIEIDPDTNTKIYFICRK